MKLKQTLGILSSLVVLTACGGTVRSNYSAMTPNYAAPQGYAAYGQQAYGQTLAQPQTLGQTAYTQPGAGAYPSTAYAMPTTGYAQQPEYNAAPAQTAPVARNATTTRAAKPTTASIKSPAAAPKTAAKTPAKATTAPKTTTKASTPKAAPQVNQTEQWLAQARQSLGQLQGMIADVAVFEKGLTPGNGQIRYYYRQGQVKIDIINSSDAGRKGVKLAYQAGSNEVKARASGVLSLVAVTLSMSDSKVKSGRQYLLNQIDLTATTTRLTQPGLQGKAIGKTSMGGSEVVVIEFVPQNHFDGRITKERLGIDLKTFLPRMHEMYEGNELVYSSRVEQVQINPNFGPKDFEV